MPDAPKAMALKILLEEEEVEEEVDFENSSFGSGREEIWTDYAEDLDYDQ